MSILASHEQLGGLERTELIDPVWSQDKNAHEYADQKYANFIFIFMFIYCIMTLYRGIRIHVRKHIDYIDHVFVLVPERGGM